jgi:hypothetical protein
MNAYVRRAFRPTLCLAVILLGSSSAWAQERPDVYVLSVGIDKYQAPVHNLSGCVNDAVGMAKVFQGQQGKRFGKVETHILLDSQATQAAIVQGLDTLRNRGRSGDWYVIVLSGHGGNTREQWGFLTHERGHVTDVAILGLADELAGAGKMVVILIDACDAGQLRYAANAVLNRHIHPRDGGIIVMVSSMADQLSAALGSYSAFAHAVEEGLSGLADYDGDGSITLQELRRFTFNRVYELRLKTRAYPGLLVEAQDSAIDASLSMPESSPLVQATRPPTPVAIPDEPLVTTPASLCNKTWKIGDTAAKGPSVLFELTLDSFGHYRAVLMKGTKIEAAAGAYKAHAKSVDLIHRQGVDRLDIVALTPSEFDFRFEGKDYKAKLDVPAPPSAVAGLSGRWIGTEDLPGYGALTFEFAPAGVSFMTDRDGRRQGTWKLEGAQVTLAFYNGTVVYRGTVAGYTMSGMAASGSRTWNWRLSQEPGTAPPAPPAPPVVAGLSGRWVGTEDLPGYGALTFEFAPAGVSFMTDKDGRRQGTWKLEGTQVTLIFYDGTVMYRGAAAGNMMSGTATSGSRTWNWRVSQEAGTAPPAQQSTPHQTQDDPPAHNGRPTANVDPPLLRGAADPPLARSPAHAAAPERKPPALRGQPAKLPVKPGLAFATRRGR